RAPVVIPGRSSPARAPRQCRPSLLREPVLGDGISRPPMSNYDPMNRPRREQRRHAELGAGAQCAGCSEPDINVLMKERRLLEEHHVLGQSHAPDVTIILCRNCHAKYTAAQYDDGVPLTPQSSHLERFFAVVDGAASTLGVLSRALQVATDRVREHVIPVLDQKLPDWRKYV